MSAVIAEIGPTTAEVLWDGHREVLHVSRVGGDYGWLVALITNPDDPKAFVYGSEDAPRGHQVQWHLDRLNTNYDLDVCDEFATAIGTLMAVRS